MSLMMLVKQLVEIVLHWKYIDAMYSSILPDDPEIRHMMASYPILRPGSNPTCSMLTWFPEFHPSSENGQDIRKHSGAGYCENKPYLWVLIWLPIKMLNLCWALTQLRGEEITTDREPMLAAKWRMERMWPMTSLRCRGILERPGPALNIYTRIRFRGGQTHHLTSIKVLTFWL